MANKSFITIGRVLQSHGLKGEVKISISRPVQNWPGVSFLYLGDQNSPIPYFIESRQISSSDLIFIKFEDIDQREAATSLKGKDVLLDETQAKAHLTGDMEQEVSIEDLLSGYRVFDANGELLGAIEELMEVNGQLLATLIIQDKDVMIPIAEDLILELDHDKEYIKMEIPDGLLDVYLKD